MLVDQLLCSYLICAKKTRVVQDLTQAGPPCVTDATPEASHDTKRWSHLHSPVPVRHALTFAQIRGSLIAVSQTHGASAGFAVGA